MTDAVRNDMTMLNSLFFNVFYKGIEDKVFNTTEEIDLIFENFRKTIASMNINPEPQTWNVFVEETKRRLSLVFDYGNTISDGSSEPWTEDCWQINERYFWDRYVKLLNNKDWPTKVIKSIDRVTEDVLNLCGNPSDVLKPWQKRGLVIGDVQSGKTAVFTGLINKAADAGYQVFIVLTGTLETLRQQTQARLEKEFVGLSSNIDRNNAPIGVGKIDPQHKAFCCTSVHSDFKRQNKINMNFQLASVTEPVLLVLKKNKNVLQTVKDWLRTKNLDGQFINKSLLLIDDEADNASINTSKTEEDPTAINNEIRELLALFKNATYVGFTATPFANVFINPDPVDGKPDDLFPRNFIRTTDIPDNYFGSEKFLGIQDGNESDDISSDYICTIEDADNFIPLKHKSNFVASDLWPSIRTAVRQFILVNAIIDVRKLEQKHRTMMINVSRFTKVQNQIADLVESYLDQLVSEIKIHGKSPLASKNLVIKELHDTFNKYYCDCGCPWEKIKDRLFDAVKNIRVYTANTTTKANAALKYDSNNGVRAIVVGGQAIARGITLEGLCVSYFYRSTAYYDTLMQMGRWFGYRPGYEDLCKIWVSETTADYYRQISRATAELKDEIAEMQRAGLTPKDFGLRVRESPDALLITSRNKMRVSKSFEIRTLFSSYFTESIEIPVNKACENLEATRILIREIRSLSCQTIKGLKKRTLYLDVPKELIADFMDRFNVDASCYMLASYGENDKKHGLANFIRNNKIDKLQNWDVVIDEGSGAEIDIGTGNPVKCLNRRINDKNLWEKGKLRFYKSRIAGSDVEAATLSEAEYKKLLQTYPPVKKGEKRTHIGIRQACRRYRTKPLLILMPCLMYDKETDLKQKSISDHKLSDQVFMAYALSFCYFADPGSSREVKVLYKVNKTWFKEHLDDDDDGEDM